MKSETQRKLVDCGLCTLNRSRPNTLDKFTKEYKNTLNYCEHYKEEVEDAGQFFCDYFDRVYPPMYIIPMEPCIKCGYYANGHYEDGTPICYECLRKQ